jgi:hypothetical protein
MPARVRAVWYPADGLTILQACPDLANETGFTAAFEAYRKALIASRKAMMKHPCVRIWLSRIAQLLQLDRLGTNDQITLRTLLAHSAILVHAGPGPEFSVQRFDIDPLLAAAIPPSYSFAELDVKRQREAANPYSLAFANEASIISPAKTQRESRIFKLRALIQSVCYERSPQPTCHRWPEL